MNLLLIDIHLHIKNKIALFQYQFNITCIYHTNLNEIDLSKYDIVYSPHLPINVSLYPNTKFIFGPHFSVLPEKDKLDLIVGPNSTYIMPSDWVCDLWKSFNYPITIKSIPFGVDTNKFKPINTDSQEVFIYYKRRKPEELLFIQHALRNIHYKLFNYTENYDEQSYLDCLQHAKYGIIIDASESQGFAIEEALSCNVPLLVWNVSSLNQTYGIQYDDYSATSIPYWDCRCGEFFYHQDEFEMMYKIFLNKLHLYKPRQYILDHLSIDKCRDMFLDIKLN